MVGARDAALDALGYDPESRDVSRDSWAGVAEAGPSFCPRIGKLDFRKWYYQWAVSDPMENVAAVYDPEAKKYRYFALPSAQFGAL